MSVLSITAAKILPTRVYHKALAWRAVSRGHNPELQLLRFFESGGSFIDVGANIGDYSRVGAGIFKRVLAFEPQADLVTKLETELPDNVTVYPFALSHEAKSTTLYIPFVDNKYHSGLASLDTAHLTGVVQNRICETRTLDSFNFTYVDAIKIDVEGFETSAILGGLATIRDSHPAMIVEIEDRPLTTDITPLVLEKLPSLKNSDHWKHLQAFELLFAEGYLAFYYLDGGLYPVYPDFKIDVNRHTDGRFVNNFIFLYHQRVTLTGDVIYCGKHLARYEGDIGYKRPLPPDSWFAEVER